MQKRITPPAGMTTTRLLLVLAGFPLVSTLVSLLLLDRTSLSWTGLDFFTAFWTVVTLWYATQVLVLSRVLKASGWRWRDIGYGFDRRRTAWLVSGYLVLAFSLLAFIELALAGAALDAGKLQAVSNLTPRTTTQRVVFIFMGLAAGLCEELVYRGFAIRGLESRGVHRWLAVVIAAIPFVFQHGLKSLDQFWWFFLWGVVFGAGLVLTRWLYVNIVVHWLVILAAMLAILQALG